MTRSVAVVLFPDFSNLCLANVVEPLRAANTLAREPLYSWRFVGLDTGVVQSSSGLPVAPEMRLGALPDADYLMVMPSYGYRRFATPATLRTLRAAARRSGAVVGLDTGSLLLAEAGVMDGRRATAHWDVLTEFEERFPEVEVVRDRIVIDGDRMSCGGASTALELMLDLIGRHHGAGLSLKVAELFMLGEHRPAPTDLRTLPQDRIVRAAAALMRRNIEHPLAIPAVAQGLGISQRGLEQRFRAAIGRTPRHLYAAIRLAEAWRLVDETPFSITEIAARVGYQDASAMTRAFRAEYGVTPQRLRARAGPLHGPHGG